MTGRQGIRHKVRAAWGRLRGGQLSPERAAASVALGVFVGFLPLYGLHGAICLAVALPLKLDFAIAFLVTNLSNPLTVAFVVALDVGIGSWVRRGAWVTLSPATLRAGDLGALFGDALVGGALLGLAAGLVAGGVVFAAGQSMTRTPST